MQESKLYMLLHTSKKTEANVFAFLQQHLQSAVTLQPVSIRILCSQVLLLDEPTSALDPSATLRVEETILNLRKTTGLTVLWVSHSVEQVERVADVAVLLVKGQIVDICPPQELRNSEHPLAQQFIAGELDSTL